jgi:hypothetical protein
LIGYYIEQAGQKVIYLDPLADDTTNVVTQLDSTQSYVVLLAHNRFITYGYTGDVRDDTFYCDIPEGSIIVDPWRKMPLTSKHTVIHYGNTRQH